MKHFILKVLLLSLFISPVAAAQSSLQLNVVDGKTQKSILQMSSSQNATASSNISVKSNRHDAKDVAPESWDFTITNNDSSDRWLYLNWQLTWNKPTDINTLHYWGGRDQPVSGEALLRHPYVDGQMNATMLQALYDNESGMALALPPSQIVSDLNQSLIKDGNKLIMQLQIPLALSPGESDTFPIETYYFTPRYGFLDALQKYFSAHPAEFTARTDIDPRAAGVGGSRPWADSVTAGLPTAAAKVQRFGTDWEWFYAPFRRTGDIYTHNEYWDYPPVKPFNYFADQPSPEKFREFRHQLLSQVAEAGAVAAYYVPSFLYSEIELAKTQYPDAIIRKPDGSYARFYKTPWVLTTDQEVALYPWGNKFAEQSMKDARQVVAENPVYAFGYDVMAGEFRFRGKGMKESPRRAFDKDGEYVNSGVAVAKMADFTRNLEKDGKKVGLVGNITSESRPYLVARSDTLMCEQPPYFYGAYEYGQDGSLIAMRYAAGHKAITFWSGWKMEKVLNTKEMTPEQLRAAYQGTADFIRLTSYRFGAYPNIRANAGIPRIVKELPLLKEVIMQGWQAVPAVRGENAALPNSIWPARYGNDLGSFITLGNAQKTDWNGTIIIDNDYLGASNYVFVAQNAGKVLSQEINGRQTILQVQIPARDTLVLSAVAAIPTNAAGNAKVTWMDNGANGTLSMKSTFAPTKVLSPRDGWELKNHNGGTWQFASRYFDSPTNEIQNFPFYNGAQTAQIVLQQNANTDEQWAAKQLQNYFVFWGKNGVKPSQDITLPIAPTKAANKPNIVIGGNNRGVQIDGNTLIIGSQNVRDVTNQLMTVLNQKYFYTDTLPTTGSEAAGMKKAGITGKVLD